MSFLAGLREQRAPSQQTLKLMYLLSFDGQLQTFYLQLCLGGSLEPTPNAPEKNYRIQREHLKRPPAFLSDEDQSILNNLLGIDDTWPGNATGTITALHADLVEQMVRTGRAFYVRHAKAWAPLSLGSSQNIRPYWSVDGCGTQTLSWHSETSPSQQYAFTQEAAYYISSHTNPCVFGPCTRKEVNADAPYQTHIHSTKVAEFLQQNKREWVNWHMPLPKQLNEVTQHAQLQGLLYCRSANATHATEHIQLAFSTCCDAYSTLPSIEPQPESYCDGLNVNQLPVDQEELQHQMETAKAILASFGTYCPTSQTWSSDDPESWLLLFNEQQEQLTQHGLQLLVEPSFRYHFVKIEKWRAKIHHGANNTNSLDITLESTSGDINLEHLLAQLHSFNAHIKDDRYHIALADGRIAIIPTKELSHLMEELAELEFTENGIAIPNGQQHRLADLYECLPDRTHWEGDLAQLNTAISLHNSPVVLEQRFNYVNAELRPYQWLGVSWIRHLKLHGYNGLLADDMGLGKTLQTLSYLAFEKQLGELSAPALIVLPLSLVHNWANEINRFTQQLRYKIIHGPKRHDHWHCLGDYDILITTYHLAAADIDHWKEQELSWLILDEAQNIKNPKTRFSQALREIPCPSKLCLSGTPVENHLGELWSILSFLNTGCLGTQQYFKSHYQKPIEQLGDGKRMQQLLKHVAPFMLRRTKDQIAQDLPEKTEISQLIPLGEAQRKFYEQIKQDTWDNLQSTIEQEENKGRKHLAALTALLKLRQACCDPQLMDQDTPSAKKDYCIEMIEELVAENRAVLVFSQFTKMLDILEKALDDKAIANVKLTGSTRNRQATIDSFQRGEAPVFLISLKAGGAGLNLTRADTVIHYDPWWNSAAERQASDRAHRIGQDKPVFVYKLIAEETIEEKIAILQEQKASLSQHIDNRAQSNADSFALQFEELLTLWQEGQK